MRPLPRIDPDVMLALVPAGEERTTEAIGRAYAAAHYPGEVYLNHHDRVVSALNRLRAAGTIVSRMVANPGKGGRHALWRRAPACAHCEDTHVVTMTNGVDAFLEPCPRCTE